MMSSDNLGQDWGIDMPEETKDKKIAYRASEEFRRRLHIAAIERGMKVQGLIDAAVDAYLEADAPGGEGAVSRAAGPFASLTAAETKFIEEMLGFFRNADAASIKLVRQHAAAIAELRASRGSLRRTG